MKRAFIFCFVAAWASTTGAPSVADAAGQSCAALLSLSLKDAKVTSAADVAAGAFKPAGNVTAAAAKAYAALPAFCRVEVTSRPTSDSEIKSEIWMPVAGWNGKFQAVGNGGWAGTIAYPAMAAAVTAGYATASTDTGHATPGSAFAIGHPEKLIDYAYRGVHEMTVAAKATVGAYYAAKPKLSFWNGCSTGGRQGATEASRYPEDFDAIIAGASPDPSSLLHAIRLAAGIYVNRAPGSRIPQEKYPALHRAVLEACDALDGVKDGVIENPTRCKFDPKTIECKNGVDGADCLTSGQVETAAFLYAPVRHPKTGQILYPPLLQPGSELQWNTLAGAEPFSNAMDGFRVAFGDPSWDWHAFNPATDIERIQQKAGVIDSATPNLKPFFDRGGKLLMYHGWGDRQVPSMSSIGYYTRVLDATGAQNAGKSIALYMVPGMDHCQGGEGTDVFDKMKAIESWVATGRAPERIEASRVVNGAVVRTRPLCPYPQVAKYDGSGNPDSAASFSCGVEK